MEKEKKNGVNLFDEICIKVLNIYKSIVIDKLDITKISEKSIIPNEKNIKINNLMIYCEGAIIILNTKSYKNMHLTNKTIDFTEAIENILKNIEEQREIIFYNIYKLYFLYHLYEFINSNTDFDVNEINITDNIIECIGDKFILIKYLAPIIFRNRINSFLQFKSLNYAQYKISLPILDNYTVQDINLLT